MCGVSTPLFLTTAVLLWLACQPLLDPYDSSSRHAGKNFDGSGAALATSTARIVKSRQKTVGREEGNLIDSKFAFPHLVLKPTRNSQFLSEVLKATGVLKLNVQLVAPVTYPTPRNFR